MEKTNNGDAKKRSHYSTLPLIYSCSGCSSAAQLTNRIAVSLDRQALAEMSCIAGVGGNVKSLLRKAQSGRKILVLDGCPLHCARHSLEQQGVKIDTHIDLSTQGIKKRLHADASEEDFITVWEGVILPTLKAIS